MQNTFSETFSSLNAGPPFVINSHPSPWDRAIAVSFDTPTSPAPVTVEVTRNRPVLPEIDFNLPAAFSVGRYYRLYAPGQAHWGNAQFSLRFFACEDPAAVLASINNLVVLHKSASEATWSGPFVPTVTDLGNDVYEVSYIGPCDADQWIGLGLSDRILPVELTSFDAAVINGEVALAWSTASESNVARFELARNGSKIAEVAAQNNATGANYNYTDRPGAGQYNYELSEVTLNGEHNVLGLVSVELGEGNVVTEYELSEAYPNPFNPQTNIDFVIPNAGYVTLNVFNPLGQIVATLVDGQHDAGSYSVQFDGANLTSSIYFYRLETGSFSAMKKMVLVK